MTYRKSFFYTVSNAIRKARPSIRKVHILSPLEDAPSPPNWSCGAVEQQPDIRLHNWSAIDAVDFERSQCASTRHVIGNTQEGHGFCLSSEIRIFDPKTQRALAKNGTVYELVGDATLGSLAYQKCHRWAKEQLLHTINSTRMFAHAVATAKPTVVYTIALATVRNTPPVELGRLSVTRSGTACDATFQGSVWSDEVRTLHLSESIREDEPICSLLVRLLEKVSVSERVSAALPTDFFKLSVHIGTTTHRALEIEALETAPEVYGNSQYLKFTDMHDRETRDELPEQAVSPIDFIVAAFPSMGKRYLCDIDYEREELMRLTAPRAESQSRPAVEGEYWDDMADEVPF